MIFLVDTVKIDATAAIFGYIGSVLASVFLIPQVYKVIKTKSIKDVSMVMTSIIVLGTLIWLTYGFLSAMGSTGWLLALPVIISNIAQLICSLVLITLKLIYMGKINLNKNKGEN